MGGKEADWRAGRAEDAYPVVARGGLMGRVTRPPSGTSGEGARWAAAEAAGTAAEKAGKRPTSGAPGKLRGSPTLPFTTSAHFINISDRTFLSRSQYFTYT
jgi:hypothetical protein